MPKLSFARPLADSAAAVAIVAAALSARAGSLHAAPSASVCFPHTRSRPPAPAAPRPPLARGSASLNGTARVTLPVRQVLSFEPFAFFLLSLPRYTQSCQTLLYPLWSGGCHAKAAGQAISFALVRFTQVVCGEGHLGMLLEDGEDAVDVNVLCICNRHGAAAPTRPPVPASLLLGLPIANCPRPPHLRLHCPLLSFRPSLHILNVHSVHPRSLTSPRGRTGTPQNTPPPLPSPSRAGGWTAATTKATHATTASARPSDRHSPLAGQPDRGPGREGQRSRGCFRRGTGTGLRS